jgi:CRISPR type III-A-associated protein Csm2
VKQLEYKFEENNLIMLKPKLSYTAAKAGDLGTKILRTVLVAAIEEVMKREDKKIGFRNFVNLFESILAYHRAAGGR